MITIIDHPLLKHHLTILRDKSTNSSQFYSTAKKATFFLAHEAFKYVSLEESDVTTPLQKTTGHIITDDIVIIPILRAGLVMVEPLRELFPPAKIGYIGMKRNEETYEAEEYLYSLPEIHNNSLVILSEVMIATGGSLTSALSRLQLEGAEKILILALIAAPEGVEKILTEYPGVHIITGSLDEGLNEDKYIVPGLGDAGDRLHGTL